MVIDQNHSMSMVKEKGKKQGMQNPFQPNSSTITETRNTQLTRGKQCSTTNKRNSENKNNKSKGSMRGPKVILNNQMIPNEFEPHSILSSLHNQGYPSPHGYPQGAQMGSLNKPMSPNNYINSNQYGNTLINNQMPNIYQTQQTMNIQLNMNLAAENVRKHQN